MDIKEHFYFDDPNVGHPDVRTNPANCIYYFLGNGLIQVAVQVNRSGLGTPLGLLFMHPEKFGKKRETLNFHAACGIEDTQIQIDCNNRRYQPNANSLKVNWQRERNVPIVCAEWQAGPIRVSEEFYCPAWEKPRLRRVVTVLNQDQVSHHLTMSTGIFQSGPQSKKERVELSLNSTQQVTMVFEYTLQKDQPDRWLVELARLDDFSISPEIQNYWKNVASVDCHDSRLNHLFAVSCTQLPAVVAKSGVMDGSIWQYNLEWVRDQSMVAIGLLMAGHQELALTMFERILHEFVTEHGDTVDSGRLRDPAEVELDQNGLLLWTAWMLWMWCGESGFAIVQKYWKKIIAVAEFPLQEIFWDKESHLLKNTREYWERHAVFGIREGYELMYQFFVAMGLEKAAVMAEKMGEPQQAKRWQEAAATIKQAMLASPRFTMIEDGHLIKRRLASGEMQRAAKIPDRSVLTDGIPLKTEPINYLDPDASEALPIAFEFIDPQSALAKKTLTHLEALWNMRWSTGGYSRYHVSSEPDSPGPWPFATLFIARAYHEAGDYAKVSRALQWLAEVQGGEAGTWFEFYGPRPVPPCPQVGLVPWTWAEIIFFFIHHLLGVRPESDNWRIRPRLLPTLNSIKARVRVHNCWIDLNIHRAATADERGAIVNGKKMSLHDDHLILPLPENDLNIELKI